MWLPGRTGSDANPGQSHARNPGGRPSRTRSALTADDILKAARTWCPCCGACGRGRQGPADRARHYRRLGDAGFFHILKPKKYGGLELSEHEHAKVAMTLARGCASTAWVFSILSSDNMAVLAFPEQVQEEVWGTDTFATLAVNTNSTPRPGRRRSPAANG